MRGFVLKSGIVALALFVALGCLSKMNSSTFNRNHLDEPDRVSGQAALLRDDRKTVAEFAKSRLFDENPFELYSIEDLALRRARSHSAAPRPIPSEREKELCPLHSTTTRISSDFASSRTHPVRGTARPHHGIDCVAPYGTPVYAVSDGQVLFAGRKGEYGKLIVLSHEDQWSTWYGHLSKIESNIRKGVRVRGGEIIGRVGTSGLATGPHLHFETRMAGKPVSPSLATLTRPIRSPR